ncbi:MAG TPA: recombinase family protein [Candidatus Elarobacter sp.]|jgi:DNA invertase Pin-like site-specific DNA recombinase
MVAYFRVSTKRQEDSGAGLDAQRAAVARYVADNGCDLIGEYVEVETGKKHDLDNRPELRRAVAHTKRSRAILVVSKLDRLLRSTVVRNTLKTKGVRFVAVDNPHANELTIDILAAVAANEVRQIGERTRAGLASLKRKGVLLGGARAGHPKPTRTMALAGAAASASVRSKAAAEAYEDLIPTITELRGTGLSLRQIAARLNDEGHTTRSGKPWNPMQVSRLLHA